MPCPPHAEHGPIHGHGVVDALDAMDDASVELAEKRRGFTDWLFKRHVVSCGITVRRDEQVVYSRANHGNSLGDRNLETCEP